MNVFVLHLEPHKAAQMHNDRHVCKMIVEYAQLMSTAHHKAGSAKDIMYKATHPNHPCNKWVRRDAANYRWLYALFCNLCDEYTYRYDKVHKTDKKLRKILSKLPANLLDDAHKTSRDVTGFALAMPDQYKDFNSAVRSYRYYYRCDKQHIAHWTRRGKPEWWQ